MPRLSNLSRGLRSYGDRVGAISSNVASNVGNLRMRAADARARGIEGRGRTFQNLAQGLSGMVGQELMAQPQRRMAAEDRRMALEERDMRMGQAGQDRVLGAQQIAMNDEKMFEMQEARRRTDAVVGIYSEHVEEGYSRVAAALDEAGLHEDAAAARKKQREEDEHKGKMDEQELKQWNETNNLWILFTGNISKIAEDQRAETYPEARRVFLTSPMGKKMAEEKPELLDQLLPETPDPATFKLLANANIAARMSGDNMKRDKSKVELEQGRLESVEDWQLFVGKQLVKTSTNQGYTTKRNHLLDQMPQNVREVLEPLMPEQASKQVRADLRRLVNPVAGEARAGTLGLMDEENVARSEQGLPPLSPLEYMQAAEGIKARSKKLDGEKGGEQGGKPKLETAGERKAYRALQSARAGVTDLYDLVEGGTSPLTPQGRAKYKQVMNELTLTFADLKGRGANFTETEQTMIRESLGGDPVSLWTRYVVGDDTYKEKIRHAAGSIERESAILSGEFYKEYEYPWQKNAEKGAETDTGLSDLSDEDLLKQLEGQ